MEIVRSTQASLEEAGPVASGMYPWATFCSLLPTTFRVHSLDRQLADYEVPLPDELALTASFSANRRREFTAGRYCAGRALQQMGIESFPVLIGKGREPVWPSGICGSITHSGAYCAAAVARRNRIVAVGIDMENWQEIDRDLWSLFCTQDEIDWLEEFEPAMQPMVASVVFSGKEAFFKCQFSLTGRWLEFGDVALSIRDGQFGVMGPEWLGAWSFAGRYGYLKNSQMVLTAVIAVMAG